MPLFYHSFLHARFLHHHLKIYFQVNKRMDLYCHGTDVPKDILRMSENHFRHFNFVGGWKMTSWWFQPIWKICSSNWIISPGRDEHKKIFKTTNQMSEARFWSSSWTPKSPASRLKLVCCLFNGCFVIVYATFWRKKRPLSSDVNHILEKKRDGSFRLEVASNKNVKFKKKKKNVFSTNRSVHFPSLGGGDDVSPVSPKAGAFSLMEMLPRDIYRWREKNGEAPCWPEDFSTSKLVTITSLIYEKNMCFSSVLETWGVQA